MSAILDAAGRLAEELERGGFDYAMSGAIALAYWATPRATVDIDVAVDADVTRGPELLATLRAAGCQVDEERALAAAERGDFGCRMRGIRVDVFLPVLAISVEALTRRIRVPFGEREIWILSAEDLLLFKLVFGRTKDFADIEQLLAARHDRLDHNYIDRWLDSLFGGKDPRLTRFHELRQRARG